ncbi:Protein MON2 homolog [Geodia barretti]|nr:Protein MON2 homolog [Geodia barretti]
MLVRFLDSDKPLWQRTLAMEVLHSFTNHPLLLRSFCEYYDMQEHSSRIFSDIINAVGGFIQSYLTSVPAASVQLPFGITSSGGGAINSSTGHVTSLPTLSGRHVHMFTIRGTVIQVEALPPNSHHKQAFLEMLDKSEVPVISEGYTLVVAMTALIDAVKSVSLVVTDEVKAKKHVAQFLHRSPSPGGDVKEMMLKSSWSGVLASLALLLDSCNDEYTARLILQCSHKFIQLCGLMSMTVPRDAFLTALCKSCLPPRFTLSLITSHRTTRSSSSAAAMAQEASEKKGGLEGDPVIIRGGGEGAAGGSRKKLAFSQPGEGAVSGGSVGGGGEGGGGKATTPVSGQKGMQSALVTVKNLQCTGQLLKIISDHGNLLDTAWLLVLTAVQHIKEVFGLSQIQSQTLLENSSLSLVNVEKKSEVSAVVDKLNSLFKNTKKLSGASLDHLISALCQLSLDEVSSSPNREPSLFAMTSLLETGVANLERIDLIWPPITSHLSRYEL